MSCKVLFLSFLAFTANVALAQSQSLCASSEKIILSFQESKSKKLTSICRGDDSKYLVYRFGSKNNVELQYPHALDESSWKKFEYFGRRRPGGKMNAGFGDYWLSFKNGSVEYTVFQEWSDEDDTYSIGINVDVKGKAVVLSGSRKTQQGSLVLLESEAQHLKNSADE